MNVVVLNHSNNDYFGIDIKGNMFTIKCVEPSPMFERFRGSILCTTTYEERDSIGSSMDVRPYTPPMPQIPITIREYPSVIFYSREELKRVYDKFGKNGSLLVSTYLTNSVSAWEGAFKATINLNDKDFYIVVDKKIYDLPKCSEEFKINMMKEYGIEYADLESRYVFVISTVIKYNNETDKCGNTHLDIKSIPKHGIKYKGDPILLVDNGISIFENREAAQMFIEKYNGSIEDYLIEKVQEEVETKYKDKIKELLKTTKEEKKSIASTLLLLGGTSVFSIIVEKTLQYLITKDKKKEVCDIVGFVINARKTTTLINAVHSVDMIHRLFNGYLSFKSALLFI